MSAPRVFAKFISLTALFGSVGYFLSLALDWLVNGDPYWTSDGFFSWAVFLTATALFFGLICTPVQLLVRRQHGLLRFLAGISSGPVFIWLLFAIRGEHLSVRNYISAPGVYPLLITFALLGAFYSLSFGHMLGPNNSFNPTAEVGPIR